MRIERYSRVPLDGLDEKVCRLCERLLPLDDFHVLLAARDGRGPWCKTCTRVHSTIHHSASLRATRDARRADAPQPELPELSESEEEERVAKCEQTRKARLRRRGVAATFTGADYDRLFAQQGGLCAICRKPEVATYKGRVRMLCVDHDHETGAVRELLCSKCNVSLGAFGDDPAILLAAICYLARHGRSLEAVSVPDLDLGARAEGGG